MKKLNLEAFKALQVTATEKIEGGLYRITGSGKGTVDFLWDSGVDECDISTVGLGWGSGWNGSGNDPYVGMSGSPIRP